MKNINPEEFLDIQKLSALENLTLIGGSANKVKDIGIDGKLIKQGNGVKKAQ